MESLIKKKKIGHLVLKHGGLEYYSWYLSPSSLGTMLLIWRKNKLKNNNNKNKNNNDNKSNNNKVYFFIVVCGNRNHELAFDLK